VSDDRRFYAYELHERAGDMPLTAAPVDRDWMDASDRRAAYRCLPLAIANQAGWLLPCPAGLTAYWDGGPGKDSVRLDFDPPPGAAPAPDPFGGFSVVSFAAPAPAWYHDARVSSHFGNGVITFSIPYLFRTPPGVNLWVKGPSNFIKDGVQPLEGVVETDWLPATFTMNWKLTRPYHAVRFEPGEPICMLVPVPRGLAEGLEPLYAPLGTNPELERDYREWERSRAAFNAALADERPEAVQRGWQRDYMKGLTPRGARAAEHQTRLQLREFRRGGE
jgi:Family of unknown function (DUF6065)